VHGHLTHLSTTDVAGRTGGSCRRCRRLGICSEWV
jgi:hypothetical protein